MKNRIVVWITETAEKFFETLDKYEGYILLFMLGWLIYMIYMPMPGEGQ